MHVKEIIIWGFGVTASAAECITVGPFCSDSKNAIFIGNNSCKSVLLKAISFALHYTSDLEQLPNEFCGTDGSVELVFENSVENALPTLSNEAPTTPEIRLKRSITSNQISYQLDGKSVERIQVKHFIDLLGFSNTYPFHCFIRLTDVHTVAMSNASARFEWLRSCNGFSDFLVSKTKSQKKLTETGERIVKIDEFLHKIDVHLTIFSSDENQIIYKRWMEREKELGHCQARFRSENLRKQLANLDAEEEKLRKACEVIKVQASKDNDMAKAARSRIKVLSTEIIDCANRQINIKSQLSEMISERSSLIESINRLERKTENDALLERHSDLEKEILQKSFNEQQIQLQSIDAELDRLCVIEKDYLQIMASLEQHINSVFLNAEQNRRMARQFLSLDDRNTWISGQLKKINKSNKKENRYVQKFNAEFEQEQIELDKLKELQAKNADQLKSLLRSIHSIGKLSDLQKLRKTLINELEDITTDMHTLSVKLATHETALKTNEERLRSIIGNSLYNGVISMRLFVATKCPNELKECYYGPVIDNFKCDVDLYRALSILAGRLLFYHIVDTHKTASKLISLFNTLKFPGEIKFFPLNLLNADMNGVDNQNEVFSRISFDAKYEKVFRHIFNEIEFCGNLDEAIAKSRNAGQCVTMDCDFVSMNDAFCGGNIEPWTDCIELHHRHTQLEDVISSTKHEFRENDYKISEVNARIHETENSIENQKENAKKYKDLLQSLETLKQQISCSEDKLKSKRKLINKHESKLGTLAAEAAKLTQELEQPLLSHEEQQANDKLTEEYNGRRDQNRQVANDISELKGKRNSLKEFLEGLLGRQRELDEFSMTFCNRSELLKQQQDEISRLEENIHTGNDELSKLNAAMSGLNEEKSTKKKEIADNCKRRPEIWHKQTNIFQHLKTLEIQKKLINDELSQISEYQAVEDEVKAETSRLTEKEVSDELKEAQHQIKKFNETNQFDIIRLDTFKSEREKLVKRRAELTKIERKIICLINKLESDNLSAFQATFECLAKSFAEIFVKMVPSGAGRLQLTQREKDNDQSDIHAFGGLEIYASFGMDEHKLENLSNEEKQIAALVFIFTMQQNNRVPFYLYDCIDETLSEQTRISLANLIEELSSESQYMLATSNHLDFLNVAENIFQVGAVDCWYCNRLR